MSPTRTLTHEQVVASNVYKLQKLEARSKDKGEAAIKMDAIGQLLVGEWRVYIKQQPPTKQMPHSYGMIIDHFDAEGMTFTGRSAVAGKYVIEDGNVVWNNLTKHCTLTYTENWLERRCKESFTAYLKSNGKFRCAAKEGDGYFYDTKAPPLPLPLPPHVTMHASDRVLTPFGFPCIAGEAGRHDASGSRRETCRRPGKEVFPP